MNVPGGRRSKRAPKKSPSAGERRLLGYLNNPQPPADMLRDVAFAGVRLTIEDAARIIRERERCGGFQRLEQVLRIPGIDVDGFLELKNGLEPRPYQLEIPREDLDAFGRFWKGLSREERERFLLVHPGFTPAGGVEAYYTSVTAGTLVCEPPAELVWREFWKRVQAWLAKRGVVVAGLAAVDGPLPIGDLIAFGLTIWLIWELVDIWGVLWEEALAAASASELARKAWELVPAIEEHIRVKLPNQQPCSHLWHYYVKEIISKLRTFLQKIEKIPGGKKAAEAARKLQELIEEFLETVRRLAPEAVDAVEEALRKGGLLPFRGQ